jgi:hypothetical protein
MVDATVYIPRIQIIWDIQLSILAKCWESLKYEYIDSFLETALKVLSSEKLRWVKNDIDRQVSYCFNFKGYHIGFCKKRFATTWVQIIGNV